MALAGPRVGDEIRNFVLVCEEHVVSAGLEHDNPPDRSLFAVLVHRMLPPDSSRTNLTLRQLERLRVKCRKARIQGEQRHRLVDCQRRRANPAIVRMFDAL